MIEFGEKLKQLREEKGMTQQSLGEMLYVTRQAVSRWECGARYPDLLTTKKIAKILDVTVDELISGEELREHIEKEPVLANKIENAVQIAMYTAIAVVNILMLLVVAFTYSDMLIQSGKLSMTSIDVEANLERFVLIFTSFAGIYYSAKDKMTPKVTGIIMCIPYLFQIIGLFVFIASFSKTSGELVKSSWLFGLIFPMVISGYILLFFYQRERRLPYWIIVVICLYSVGPEIRFISNQLISVYTYGLADPVVVFSYSIIGIVSNAVMACLLGYQAYKWDRKKQIAIMLEKE